MPRYGDGGGRYGGGGAMFDQMLNPNYALTEGVMLLVIIKR